MDGSKGYSFQKSYTLKAQTPMVHFQFTQDGAVLRPSEVKPKLDRFLRRHCHNIPDQWLIPRQSALNYKMQIAACSKSEFDNIKYYRAYFGNMGTANPKGLVLCDCTMTITCFIPELLQKIDELIAEFFILENFGCRQSKGFGSFLVEGRSDKKLVDRIIQVACPCCFSADLYKSRGISDQMDKALQVYNAMKKYARTAEVINCCDNGVRKGNVGYDAELIKSMINRKPATRDSYLFVRAVMGLASFYSFREKGTIEVRHFYGTKVKNGKLQIPIASIKANHGIRRFRSPIQIKICNNKMYFLFWDDYSNILGQTFLLLRRRDNSDVSRLIKERKYEDAQRILMRAKYISTPDSFDRQQFISGFFDNYQKNMKLKNSVKLKKGAV